jgi:hypothetical protein
MKAAATIPLSTLVSALAILLLVGSVWLLWPPAASANDCPSAQGTIEVVVCWIAKQLGAAGAVVGAAIAAAAAAVNRWNTGAPPPEEPPPPPPMIPPIYETVTPRVNPEGPPAYNPGGLTGGPGP